MKIKDKVSHVSMTLEEYDQKKKVRVRHFLIISCVIFAIITTLSFVFFTNCSNDDYCSTNYFNLLNVVIISMGGIGLGYCFIILKDFNNTIDDSLIPHYKQILLDDDNDTDKKLSYEHDRKK
jgi:hypothetical protein